MTVETLTAANFKTTILLKVRILSLTSRPLRPGSRPSRQSSNGRRRTMPDIVYAKVTPIPARLLPTTVGVRSVPTIMAFREESWCTASRSDVTGGPRQLDRQINGLDMTRVRAKIAERKATANA